VNESEVPGLKTLKEGTDHNSCLAINNGTPGPEQKTTAVGYLPVNDQWFFVKYAQKSEARKLVTNEYNILRQLQNLEEVPGIINFNNSISGIMLQTHYLEGEKFKNTTLTNQVYDLLIRLSKISIGNCHDYSPDFSGHKQFAHGDFCPWNILMSSTSLRLIDWEMAGNYPAGYDLFTYIFQTQFILNPSRQPGRIFDQNSGFIQKYFAELGIPYRTSLLHEFASLKAGFTLEKNPEMAMKYRQLLKISL
jgi:hypothetical protein